MKVKVAQLCPTICSPTDCSSPGSSVHGILRCRQISFFFFFFFKPSEPPGKPWKYWSGLPFLSLGDLPSPGIKPRSPTMQAILYNLSGKESPCNEGAAGGVASVFALGRSAGGGHGNPLQYYPLQYSCLENPMDRGACPGDATVHGGRKRVGHNLETKQQYVYV